MRREDEAEPGDELGGPLEAVEITDLGMQGSLSTARMRVVGQRICDHDREVS